jgi:hypothetical protein
MLALIERSESNFTQALVYLTQARDLCIDKLTLIRIFDAASWTHRLQGTRVPASLDLSWSSLYLHHELHGTCDLKSFLTRLDLAEHYLFLIRTNECDDQIETCFDILSRFRQHSLSAFPSLSVQVDEIMGSEIFIQRVIQIIERRRADYMTVRVYKKWADLMLGYFP